MPATGDALKGYAAPLDPTGRHTLYGPPPWHFHGRMITTYLRADARDIAALVPAPMKPFGPPIARVSTYECVCDYGLGPQFAVRRPELSQFLECSIGIQVEHEGVPGSYCVFIWCDRDPEIAIGREMYGWPQLIGEMWFTRPPHGRGWAPGDECATLVSRAGRAVVETLATIDRPGDIDLGLPPFQDFYTFAVLPHPERPEVERRILRTRMTDVLLEDFWCGPATATFHAPELDWLKNAEVLGARVNRMKWTKPFGKVVHREVVPVSQ